MAPGRWGGAGVLALMFAFTGCAEQPPAIRAPDPNKAPWLELSSEHFTVWTDASADKGHALIRTMENLRTVIYSVSFFRPTSDSKCFVVALRDVGEVHAFVPPQFIAYSWSARNPLMQPVIVLPIDHLDDDRRIITHELTHAISYVAIPDQPHWFAEGVASYFETVRVDEKRGIADVGQPYDFRINTLRTDHAKAIGSLFTCNEPACMDDRYYATAWALFTYLLDQHLPELATFTLTPALLPSGLCPRAP